MKKSRSTLFFALGALVLLGAGCLPAAPDVDSSDTEANLDYGYCMNTTPWGSCIYNTGVDDALLGGKWTLVSQDVTVGSQVLTNPFAGRTLEFRLETFITEDPLLGVVTEPDLVYEEDFSTDVEDSGECITGSGSAGKWSASVGIDASDPSNPIGVTRLTIVTDPGSPVVTCEGAQVDVHATPATPLGVGAGATISGSYVAELTYNYTITGNELIITNNAGGIKNEYTYRR